MFACVNPPFILFCKLVTKYLHNKQIGKCMQIQSTILPFFSCIVIGAVPYVTTNASFPFICDKCIHNDTSCVRIYGSNKNIVVLMLDASY